MSQALEKIGVDLAKLSLIDSCVLLSEGRYAYVDYWRKDQCFP